MTEKVKCMICQKILDSKVAIEHKNKTGHNLWELMPSKEKK